MYAINTNKPLILLYVFEPSVVNDPHYDIRHWRFVWQSLVDLNQQLKVYNAKLTVLYSEMEDALLWLSKYCEIDSLFSYEEVGLALTYERDKAVSRFCGSHLISWVEFKNSGVQRGLSHRRRWKKEWQHYLAEPTSDPAISNLRPDHECLPTHHYKHDDVSVFATACFEEVKTFINACRVPKASFQLGGEKRAWHALKHFLEDRGKDYAKQISSPSLARVSCSRLSPYLAWGNISSRQVIRYLNTQLKQRGWSRTYTAFKSRIQWRSHFIQKFESEHRMEKEPVNSAYFAYPYQQDESVTTHITAWESGNTGVPIVDACMRSVIATGYMNFRMRAMLVSFLTHHLNIDWRLGVRHLGRQFLDFEPGIHYPQFQMQAGVTGTNTIRLYNPIKQSMDHDPEGIFIKQWIPELKAVPIELLHEPWGMTALEQKLYDVELGKDYPWPIIDLSVAAKNARERLWSFRDRDDVRAEAKRILYRHSLPDSPRS